MNDVDLLADLSPVAGRLLDRHLAAAREWFPHELVPWSRGRDFAPGEAVETAPLPDGVRSALVVNLLTEDNLPYYFDDIARCFGTDGAWGEWVRRWTAEEGRHSIVIRDYLTVTRQVDPVGLERDRMAQVSGGVTPHPGSVADGLVYVAIQELATRVAHHNTGKALEDRAGYEIMKRVASDENLHFLFYRDLVGAALQLDPSTVVEAIARQVIEFAMPGVGIPAFRHRSRAIARARIYDLAVHHDSVIRPLLRHWDLDRAEGLSERAERARDDLRRYVRRAERVARRIAARAGETAVAASA